MPFIDIHTHTNHSDGTTTVENSLRCAEDLGLSIFSITDHNTVSAYGEVVEKKQLFSGKILTGVELGTVYHGESIEVLGYGIDLSEMAKKIRLHYPTFYDKQVRAAKMDTEAMLRYGVVLSDAFVDAMCNRPQSIFNPYSETNRPYLLQEIKRHSENVRFFRDSAEFEHIDKHRFTREYLFNSKSSLFSDQSCFFPSFRDTVKMIHECGGLAFLAHPLLYASHFTAYLEEIASSDIDGLECCYGTFTGEQIEFLSEICCKHRVYQSGGSDFHGLDRRPNNILGQAGGKPISQALIEPWLPFVKERLL